jgi:hypothetical protein
VLQARERAPTLSPSTIFIFGLAVESIKEVGGASQGKGHHELMFKINFGNPNEEVMLAQLGTQRNACFNQSQKI